MLHLFFTFRAARPRQDFFANLLKVVVFGLLLLTLTPVVFSQDPGIPDTVRIEVDSLIVGRSIPVTVTVVNDEVVDLISLGFIFTTIDSGFAKFDSVTFINRMADPSVLNVRWVIPKSCEGVPPDSLLISCYRVLANILAPGNTAIARVYMTGLSIGNMSIDSTYFPPGSPFIFAIPDNSYFTPQYVSEAISIVEGTAPPVLTISNASLVDDANSNFFFDVEADSPEGFPVNVSLASFSGYDNAANSPTNSPSFSYNSTENNYHFSWTSSNNDIGIWRAIVTACDSVGICASSEIIIQVVENDNYVVSFQNTVSSGFNFPTGIGYGNFDDDIYPEIASTGLGYVGTTLFSIYDNDGNGTFTEVFTQADPLRHRRGLKVGYFNADELIDIVQFYHEGSLEGKGILAFPGNGNNSFSSPVASELPLAWSLFASIGKYNDDEYLDYVVGGLNTFRVFSGSSTLQFSLLNEVNVTDSIMTLTSADFNVDGYDDIAIGYRQGLKIYLGGDSGEFNLAATYSQIFGSVNIEVTNQGADFNGDDYFDLCVATPSVGNATSELMVYLGNGDGTFLQRTTRDVYGQIVANSPGDFNNDGLVDIAFLNSSRKYLGILFGDGDGNFTNELRYNIPILDPARLICTDADLDGDVDVIVNASRIPDGSYLILYENQTNPVGFTSMSIDFSGEDNAQLELVSPSNKVLNRVGNSMPSANYYRRNLNLNDKLDDYANMNLVENGDYVLTARPDPSQPAGTPFTLEFTADGLPFRMAKNATMSSTGYDFAATFAGGEMLAPRSGSFVHINPPVFAWPNKANIDFQLAADLDFSTIIIDSTIASSTFQPADALPIADTTTFYWRIKPAGSGNYGSIYALNLVPSSPSCGDVDGNPGPINVLDLNFLVNRIFRGGAAPPNFENADLDNDGKINIIDLNFLVNYIFRGGQPPTC